MMSLLARLVWTRASTIESSRRGRGVHAERPSMVWSGYGESDAWCACALQTVRCTTPAGSQDQGAALLGAPRMFPKGCGSPWPTSRSPRGPRPPIPCCLQRRYTAAITMTVSTAALAMPPIMGAAMRRMSSEPVPPPSMIGGSPQLLAGHTAADIYAQQPSQFPAGFEEAPGFAGGIL